MRQIIPLPQMPSLRQQSPDVVRVLDRIRFELDKDDSYAEFAWFAREYPRVFRHHFEHAEHRLDLIHAGYVEAHEWFTHEIRKADTNASSFARGDIRVMQIHWDFEAFLNCVGSALDVLARIVGVGYRQQLPISFSRLCASNAQGELVGALREAKSRWVDRLKDYRDCFVHYTPSETLLMISCNLYHNGWETRLRLPVNPNSRDILHFRYSRRSHVLKYAVAVHRHLVALDRRVARIMAAQYAAGDFPVRIHNLFSVGIRTP
jgi:hypothetical protein